MTSPTVPPASAERLPRPAAKRRALQLALLLGGLIGLGFLCGGQAHADDTSPSATSAPSATSGLPGISGLSHTLASRHPVAPETAPLVEKVVRPVLGTVRPVLDAVPPVLDTVRQVTEPVGEWAGQVVGGVAESVTHPLPGGPDGPPALPELPELPVDPGHALPQPGPSEPADPADPAEPAVPAATADPAAASTAATAATTATSGARTASATAPLAHDPAAESGEHGARAHAVVQAGPRTFGSAATASDGPVRRGGTHHTPVARHTAAPAPAAPGTPQRPDGAPVANASASDGGASRHSELHATSFGVRVPVLLPPGALASGAPAPVADRHRDIPEFPG
ncbi:hypothetical protein ACIRF8_21425 [Streptomyces sp. NPDC102406]|uniref:hypothetical protein n=1 Tax=Streptomyces sp. NPDC102406 TaxID=3366171 RepID=UPI0038254DC7